MRGIPRIHIVLFVLTMFSTLLAGALQQGVNPLVEPWGLLRGLPFSLTLMVILLSHELSHYYASRAHRTEATLPYFIPAPSIIGTFGAFIKMKSPIMSRKALVDIGASGPIVGFLFSAAASALGLALSDVVLAEGRAGALVLGDSILFSLMARAIVGAPPAGYDVLLHPVAFAGWIGLFVTSLNLIPIGQLDGGHIAFALLGPLHRGVSVALVAMLAVLGLLFWPGWALWAALMVVLGVKHPPVVYWEVPLARSRRLVAWASIAIFVLTFMPMPFDVSM